MKEILRLPRGLGVAQDDRNVSIYSTKKKALLLGNRYGEYLDGINRFGHLALRAHRHRRIGDLVDDVNPLRHFAEYDVIFGHINVFLDDEKLTAVGIATGIGHRYNPSVIIPSKRFVIKFIARSAGAVAFGIASLDHKVLDDTVKNSIVVKMISCQVNKIVAGNRCHAGF